MLQKISESKGFIKSQYPDGFQPEIAIILGSGLGNFIREVDILQELPFEKIPHFHKTTIDGHNGKLLFARHKTKDLLIFQGRIHFYEGHPMESITYPIRVLKFLGIKFLLLSNAAGGMNPEFSVGDLMMITDHINLMPNPLIGEHYPEFGERFPDMSALYDKQLQQLSLNLAEKMNLLLKSGVYIGTTGPTYETPAEYNYFRIIGGDAVGMSTVPEAIVAHQMGIKCFAVSVITDLGIPGNIEFISHEMVQLAAEKAEPKLARLILAMIDSIDHG
jgi:purine-nucleoside phosphorylase